MSRNVQPLLPFADPLGEGARAPRFYLSPRGDLIGPSGMCRKLSSALRNEVAKMAGDTRRKMMPRWEQYLNAVMNEDEDWRCIWTEPREACVRRMRHFIVSRGGAIGKTHPDGTIEIDHPAPSYGNLDRLAINRLYDVITTAGLMSFNPTLIKFFDEGDLDTRVEYIRQMRSEGRTSDHIGRLFRPMALPRKYTIPVDPDECVLQLEQDLRLADAPQTVMDCHETLMLNGKRPFQLLTCSALGLVLRGIEDCVACRNKRRGSRLDEAFLILTPEVRERVMARWRSMRHGDGHQTVYDLVLRCAEELHDGDPKVAGAAEDCLASIPIFPRPSAMDTKGAFLGYSGLRYWYMKGRRARRQLGERAPVLFSTGRHEPTMRDYRKATYTREVITLFDRTKDPKEREQGIVRIGELHNQSTDQSRAYGSWAYMREHLRETRETYQRVGAAVTAARTTSPAPIRTSEISSMAAKDEFEHLARRP